MKTIVAIVAFACVLPLAHADEDAKSALVQEIVQLQGADEMVREAKSATAAQAKQAIQQIFDQVKASAPALPPESLQAVRDAAEKMMRTVEASWSPEEAIRLWEEQYASDFTVDELRQVLEACKTPLGRKQIAAGKRASGALQKYLFERGKVAMDKAIKEYVADLQEIIAKRKSPSR